MPNRNRNNTAPSIRSWAGFVLLAAAFFEVTSGWTVPIAIPVLIAAVAAGLLLHARQALLAAVHQAAAHQPRADTGPRRSLAEVLYTGPADQHVGHTDRDQVITRLGDRYATGHLTAAEFETRTTDAAHARTRADLARTLRDLP